MTTTTLRLPMQYPVEFRSSSTNKGSKMVNCYIEQDGNTMYAVKRPGVPYADIAFPAGSAQGIYSSQGYLVSIVNNTFYRVTGTTYTVAGTLTGNTTPCYFSKTLGDTVLFIHKDDKAYTYNGTTFAELRSDQVSIINMTAGGTGYIGLPTVTFTAPGTGTTATGVAYTNSGGSVLSVTLNPSSPGYTYANITFSAPQVAGGVTATGVLTVSGGFIDSLTITNPGSGYTSPPTVTITGDGGGCTASDIQITGYTVDGITITDPGSGYVSAPTITIGTPWQASTAYTKYQQIYYGGQLYTVTVAGTTGTIPPSHTSGSASNGTATLTWAGIPATATCLLNGFPVGIPICPGAAYLDGYTFIMTTDGKIWNSEPNNPGSWDALNYITAEAEPDRGIALAKHFNYLLAFGEWSTEFFYDAGQVTGSPLLPNPTMRIEFGCANGDSVVAMEQTVVWVGKGQNTGRVVLMLDGTRPVQMSDASIERILNNSSLQNVRAYSLKISGHFFYVLNLLDDDLTLVLDVKSKQWCIWTSFVNGQETYFDGVFYTSHNNEHFTLDNIDGKVYNISETQYHDETGPIQMRIRTSLIDADSTKRKFVSRLEIIGDKVSAILRVRHTDDDYQNWSPYRNVNLNDPRCVLYQNGQFRRRAYEFFMTDDVPLRLQACEIDVEPGSA